MLLIITRKRNNIKTIAQTVTAAAQNRLEADLKKIDSVYLLLPNFLYLFGKEGRRQVLNVPWQHFTMDYANLITALKQDNTEKVNRLIEALRPRLMAFLRIHMNASHNDAEDCVHDSLLIAIEVMKEDRLENPDRVVSYILSICKNNYLKMQKKQREKPLEELSADPRQAPRQLQSLLDEEQKKLLKLCMEQLKEKYMVFMQYWFDHPDAHANKVANHFNISVNNAWTRKHRLIKKLNECYKKKSKL